METATVLQETVEECYQRLKARKDVRASLESFVLLKNLIVRDLNRPASVYAWSKELGVSTNTVASWLRMLCEEGCLFVLKPHDFGLPRNFRKRQKFFFRKSHFVPDEHARLINEVASRLRTAGGGREIAYIRDKDKRSVDFVVVEAGRPSLLVQVRRFNRRPDPALSYYRKRLGAETAVQIVGASSEEETAHASGVRVMSFERFLKTFLSGGES